MLVDTAGLLCYHHKAEKQHLDAKILFEQARYRLTHNYIVRRCEFCPDATERHPRSPYDR